MTSRDQSKVIAYPVLKQRLIDAQDRLDRELVVLRRMHEFATRLLRGEDLGRPAEVVSEAIVDVFEFEIGICWQLDEQGWPTGLSGCLGIDARPIDLLNAGRLLAARYQGSEGALIVDKPSMPQLREVLGIEKGLVAFCRDDRGCPSALLLGGVSTEHGQFFDVWNAETEQAFSVFAGQIGAMLASRRSGDRLESLNKELLAVFQAIPDSLFELDIHGKYLNVWPHDERLLVLSSAELIGKSVDDVMSREAATTIHAGLREASTEGASFGRQIRLDLDIGSRWFELSITRKDQDFQSTFIVLSRDVTERKDAERRLRESEDRAQHHASFDGLTALPNRLQVISRLEQLTINPQYLRKSLALMFIDLDEFKKVNDSLGHSFGDQVLLESASRIRRATSAVDMVGRLGGDEFVVITESSIGVTDVAEAILKEFRKPFVLRGREVSVTASIGIALFPADGGSSGELFRKADVAMYHAKSLGRNLSAFYTDTLNKGVERRLEIEEQLHGALDRGEIEVFYQPKYSIAEERIVGVEALVRWRNAKLGDVAPAEFVPIAEKGAQILELGRYVLERSLVQAATWAQVLNRAFSVAVNVSPRQFRDPYFLSTVRDALRSSGLDPACLELEITEGILLEADVELDTMLTELKNLGTRLVMDDFGTGYSSLSYLRTYPFDSLKVDQSFVGEMHAEKADRELVTAAVAMGHGLGLTVVAEGVESEAQLELLRATGCDFAQGYYFSKPIPAEELSELLK